MGAIVSSDAKTQDDSHEKSDAIMMTASGQKSQSSASMNQSAAACGSPESDVVHPFRDGDEDVKLLDGGIKDQSPSAEAFAE